MATRTVRKTFKVDGVLTNVTSAKLSDSTATYGIKRNDTDAVVVADDTAMSNPSTGVYEYSFTDVAGVSYTAQVEFVYDGETYRFEVDVAARSATGAMATNYTSLQERVGHFLFGIRDSFSSDQESDINDCIRDGLHDVHTAHDWSFFRPVKEITTSAPYATGTVAVASGVVTLSGGTFPSWAEQGILKVSNSYYNVASRDSGTQVTLDDTTVTVTAGTSYELAQHEYDLPTGFDAIDDDIVYDPGSEYLHPALKQRDDGVLRQYRQDNPFFDSPRLWSLRTVEFNPTVGSRRILVLYPTPDKAYVLRAQMRLRPTMIDGTNQYPIGGEMLSQLFLEACLAAAERNYDEGNNQHTKRFNELLPQMIERDLERTSPKTLGQTVSSHGPVRDYTRLDRAQRMGDVSIDGIVQ